MEEVLTIKNLRDFPEEPGQQSIFAIHLDYGISAVAYVEFPVCLMDMLFYGINTDVELIGNFFIQKTF